MSAPVIAFFNNRSRVGTTTLVYHLAWMFADLGVKVLAADLDPQGELTSAFLGSPPPSLVHQFTVHECIRQILGNSGSLDSLGWIVDANLVLLPNDMSFSLFEEEAATEWLRAVDGNQQALRIISAPWQVMTELAHVSEAQLILVDLGPNLSAISRTGMIAADHWILPLTFDRLSPWAMDSLGVTMAKWREQWRALGAKSPSGLISPLGYVVQELAGAQIGAMPESISACYAEYIMHAPSDRTHRLALLKPYRSLIEIAREARKPMFHLKPADGILGSLLQAAEDARKDFETLARAIVAKAKLPIRLS